MGAVLIRLPQVMKKTGKKRSSIYAEIAAGTFPKSVKLSKNSVAWVDQEIDDWIASKIADRDNGVAA